MFFSESTVKFYSNYLLCGSRATADKEYWTESHIHTITNAKATLLSTVIHNNKFKADFRRGKMGAVEH